MVTLRKYSHHFVVVTNDRRIIQPIYDYYRNHLSVFKFGRSKNGPREVDKTFASANKERTHFRMHINSLRDFMRYMAHRGIPENIWNIEEVEMYKPKPAKFKCIFPHPLRPKQVEIKDFIFSSKDGVTPVNSGAGALNVLGMHPTRVIPLQMGGGKTLIALYCAALLGVRTMIEISPRYRENWIKNVYGDERKLDVDEKDVLVIQSTTDLVRAVRKAKSKYEKFDYKIIICHKTTITNFIKAYVRGEPQFKDYGIKVEDLYKVLGVGLIIRDEVHEELHANANQDLHRHVPMVINLSATLEFDDPKVDDMCRIVFPVCDRYNAGEWNKYIDVRALLFGLEFPTKLKWQQFKKGPYSQAEFEKSILKDKHKRSMYATMIGNFVENYFMQIAEGNDKAALYAATIDMCTFLTDQLQERFPDKIVNRYVGEDDYDNLMSSDIVVTTPGSAGTGVDIKGLRRVIMTLAMKSSQKNFQIKGRLRELFDQLANGEIKDTVFYYFVCTDIPQHVDYHYFKKQKFRGRVKSHEEIQTDYLL